MTRLRKETRDKHAKGVAAFNPVPIPALMQEYAIMKVIRSNADVTKTMIGKLTTLFEAQIRVRVKALEAQGLIEKDLKSTRVGRTRILKPTAAFEEHFKKLEQRINPNSLIVK